MGRPVLALAATLVFVWVLLVFAGSVIPERAQRGSRAHACTRPMNCGLRMVSNTCSGLNGMGAHSLIIMRGRTVASLYL